jgi:exonuclease SbcC
MKLKYLKLKNINSIENAEIDFTKFHNSLFLITGPTGSGKTTIIDAICAALYNKTPRLKTSAKGLLRNGAKEGEIELVFEINSKEYIARWKAKRNKDIIIKTTLQSEETEIDKHVSKEVEKILKLDFYQFTKAIVLAQGEFDAFLSANSTEKTEILKNILELDEYEKISRRVYEKTNELKNEIENLKSLIPNVEEEELKQKEEMKNNILKELEKLKKEINHFEKLKEKTELLSEIERINSSLDELKKELNDVLSVYREKEMEEKNIENEYNEFETEFQEIFQLISEYEKIQETLKMIKSQINNTEVHIQNKSKEIEKLKKEKDKLLEIKSKLSKQLSNNENFDNFEEIREIYNEFINIRSLKDSKIEKIKNLEKEYKEKEKEIIDLRQKLQNLSMKIIDPLIVELEKYREKLEEGKPCPLCGSTTHPFKKNPPDITRDDLEKYKNLKNDIEKSEKELQDIKTILKNFYDDLEELESEYKKTKEKLFDFSIYNEEDFVEFKAKKEHYEMVKLEYEKVKINLEHINLNISKTLSEIEELKNELQLLQKNKQNQEMKIEKIINKIGKKDVDKLKTELQNKKRLLKDKLQKVKKEFEKVKLYKKEIESKISTLEENLTKKEEKYKDFMQYSGEYDENLYNELKKRFDSYNIELGKVQESISTLIDNLEKKKEIEKKIEKKNNDLRIYEKINQKIGSKNGKKFSKIIIRYILDSLLYLTNERLKELSDERYFLEVVSDGDDFDLKIIDTFFENKIRDVKTLSGGEKFLVSLALSFSLSDFMREKINIESMFLDEGFGTLDKEHLNKALEVLKKASRGKTIGIISHVEMLKEEIEKQINVKVSNTKSYIECKGV